MGAPTDLQSVGLLELLEIDERRVLVFDLTSPNKTVPIYSNPRQRELQSEGVRLGSIGKAGLLEETSRDNDFQEFTTWAISASANGALLCHTFYGIEWAGQTIRGRWRIIFGNVAPLVGEWQPFERSEPEKRPSMMRVKAVQSSDLDVPQNSLERQLEAFRVHRGHTMSVFPVAQGNEDLKEKREISDPKLGPFDFTAPDPPIGLSAHIRFFLRFDWAATDLGPIDSWSIELRRMVNLLLSDPRSAAMYWGPNRIMMYNEAYVAVTGQKHPGMMGKPFLQAWEEIADDFKPGFDKAYETGVATTMNEALFYIDRHGYLEETYYSISMIPFSTNEGIAFYNPVIDTTIQVISDRRLTFLLRLGQYIASSREPKDFWSQLLKALEPNDLEVPFAILYSAGGDVNETLSSTSEQSFSYTHWVLEGSVRTEESISRSPMRLSSAQDVEGFVPNFHEYIKSEYPTHLRTKDGTLPNTLRQKYKEVACGTAIFMPIRSTGDTVLGFLIIGVNPHKRYDDDYRRFVMLLSRQLATSLAAAVLFEDETRRARLAVEQAATDRNVLSKRLAIQTHEALEIENRFRRMADMAPVGMFHISSTGHLIYANEHWYNLTQHERNSSHPMSWYNAIINEDVPIMDAHWVKLGEGIPVTFEIRLKRPFTPQEEIVSGEKVEGPTWIIAAAYPEKAEDGSVIGILGCITDISRQKWTEGFQKRKKMEAIELKRQQENFIDMTSHEMRNPLSAIIQCADFIGTSVVEFDSGSINITIPREVSDSYTDAAQTIVLCAQHQKRIIDDILTLSKLDSNLLLITPVESQPVSVIESALRMFDGDLQKSDIELRFRVDSSYTDLALDWVKLDPSRMLQVLINLLTNAIKFTQLEARRKIVVNVGATLEPPEPRNEVKYLPRSKNRKDMSLGLAWGTGEIVYLFIEVQDSGPGLTDHEKNLLFQRFSQASPRTHVQYGGSGLGLFISRELTELQGGQIGVASKSGVGSMFAFYVRARRCGTPEQVQSTTPKSGSFRKRFNIGADSSSKSLTRMGLNHTASLDPQSRPPMQVTKDMHILIVEDNLVNQKVLSKQLCNAGFSVVVANHGGQALSYLETSRFWTGKEVTGAALSLILMDLEMPIMDGLTCVKRIRQLQADTLIVGHVPVIAVTANARSEQIATAKEAGMDSVVTKPFRLPELIPEIGRLLKRETESLGKGKQTL